jgi:hypothetical protein
LTLIAPLSLDHPKDNLKSTTNFHGKKTGNQGFGAVAKKSNLVSSTAIPKSTVTGPENFSGSAANLQQTAKKTSNQQKSNATNFKTTNANGTKTGMVKDPDSLIKSKELIKRVILNDSEDRWFLNPQYKVEMKPTTKLIITLLQSDEKISKIPYQKCNFMILMTRVIKIKYGFFSFLRKKIMEPRNNTK